MSNGPSNYTPELGAHCLIDLRFNGRDYFAGEDFPLVDLADHDIRNMWSAGRIAWGKPSRLLAAQLKTTLVERGEERDAAHKARQDERDAEELRLLEAEEKREQAARQERKRKAREREAKPPRVSKDPSDAADVPTVGVAPPAPEQRTEG